MGVLAFEEKIFCFYGNSISIEVSAEAKYLENVCSSRNISSRLFIKSVRRERLHRQPSGLFSLEAPLNMLFSRCLLLPSSLASKASRSIDSINDPVNTVSQIIFYSIEIPFRHNCSAHSIDSPRSPRPVVGITLNWADWEQCLFNDVTKEISEPTS